MIKSCNNNVSQERVTSIIIVAVENVNKTSVADKKEVGVAKYI